MKALTRSSFSLSVTYSSNGDIMTIWLFYAVCALPALVMAVYYLRCEHKLRSFLFGSLSGLSALFILNYFSSRLQLDMPLNLFSVVGSAVLGVPFVIFLVIFKMVL